MNTPIQFITFKSFVFLIKFVQWINQINTDLGKRSDLNHSNNYLFNFMSYWNRNFIL